MLRFAILNCETVGQEGKDDRYSGSRQHHVLGSVPNCVNSSMNGRVTVFKADLFLKKCQEILLEMLVIPKDLWRSQETFIHSAWQHQDLLLLYVAIWFISEASPCGHCLCGHGN